MSPVRGAAVALAAAATLAAGPVSAAPAAATPADHQPPAAGTASPSALGIASGGTTSLGASAQVHVTGFAPLAARPTDTLAINGSVRNGSTQTLTDARVFLWVPHRAVSARADLAPDDPPHDQNCCYYPPDLTGSGTVLGSIAAGESVPFSVSISVAGLGLPGSGVYPVGLEVRTTRGVAGRQWTWLTYLAGSAPAALPTAWLWPLAQLPTIGPLGGFTTDDLATALSAGGRLGALVHAAGTTGADGRPVPVTLVVDPSLLSAATAMTQPYTVTTADGRTFAGTGGPAARRWLAQLHDLAATDATVVLPYADPDVVALTRAGLASDVGLAHAAGAGIVTADLAPAHPMAEVAVPAGGYVTSEGLDTLVASGSTSVVLNRSGLPASSVQDGRPMAALATTSGTVMTVYAADAALSGLAGGTLAAAGSRDPALVRQRFVAETYLVALSAPARGRGLVVSPPADWRADPDLAAQLLTATGSVPWLSAVPLSALTAAGSSVIRDSPVYPASAQQAELPQSYLTAPDVGVADVRKRVDGFCAVLVRCADDADMLQMRQATWRAESALLRGLPGDADVRRDALGSAVDGLRAQVHLATGATTFTLASRNSTIPVTVANDLDRPVQVQVHVESTQARIAPADAGVIVLDPLRQRQVTVLTDARSTGTFPIYVRLVTPSGEPYGPQQRLLARSTAYGAPALAITFGAGVVLVAALGMRGVRGARRRLGERRSRG